MTSDCRYTHVLKVRGWAGRLGDRCVQPHAALLCWHAHTVLCFDPLLCLQLRRRTTTCTCGPRWGALRACSAPLHCRTVPIAAIQRSIPCPSPSTPTPQLLVDIITGGRFNFSVEVQHDGSGGRRQQAAGSRCASGACGQQVGWHSKLEESKLRGHRAPAGSAVEPAAPPAPQAHLTASRRSTSTRPGCAACMWASWTARSGAACTRAGPPTVTPPPSGAPGRGAGGRHPAWQPHVCMLPVLWAPQAGSHLPAFCAPSAHARPLSSAPQVPA